MVRKLPDQGQSDLFRPLLKEFINLEHELVLLSKKLDWEKIWKRLGYDINECAKLHRQYSISEITHKEWCKKTEIKFKKKSLKNTDLDKIASEIELMDGVKEVVEILEKITSKCIFFLVQSNILLKEFWVNYTLNLKQ